MIGPKKTLVLAACTALMIPATANSAINRIIAATGDVSGASQRPPMPAGGLECVPFARQLSGIQIYGDAHTWWDQAKGRYARGHRPRVGAVMAIEPYNNSHLGHVATVSRIIDSRTVLLSHANWSYRGQIERNVTALDVSPANDWTEVRIWYGPSRNLGTTHWPVAGFIYNTQPGKLQDLGSERLAQASAPVKAAGTRKIRRNDPIGEIISGIY